MARSRNIKPSFFLNELLAECKFESRLLFIGLWCLADREGKLEYRPKRLKVEIFPYDNLNIEILINELFEKKFIVIYEVDNYKYIKINNFSKHQNPHPKEAKSMIPDPISCKPCNYKESNGISEASNGISEASNADSLLLIPDSLQSDSPNIVRSLKKNDRTEKILITFKCNGEPKEFHFTEEHLRKFQDVFPTLDVMHEIKKAKLWQETNHKKTAKGQLRFINSWLGRANNKQNNSNKQNGKTKVKMDDSSPPDENFIKKYSGFIKDAEDLLK